LITTVALVANPGLQEMLQLKLAQRLIKLKDYLVSTIIGLTPFFLVVMSVLYFFVLKKDELYDAPLIKVIIFSCLLNLTNTTIFNNAIFALDKLIKSQILSILRQGGFLLLVAFLFLINKLSIINVFWAYCITNTFSIIYVLYLNFKDKVADRFKLAYSKELFLNSLKTYFNNVLNFLTYRANMYILQIYVGFYEFGIYSLAVTLVEKLWIFPESIRSVLYLELTSERQNETFLLKIMRLMTFFIIVSSLFIVPLSFYFIPLVFSKQYTASVLPFLILLPGALLFFYTKLLGAYFIIKNKIIINTYMVIITTSVNIILCFILIPKIFVLGASIAATASYMVGSIYHLFKFSELTKINFAEIFIVKIDDFAVIKKLWARWAK
jgi:O-antigen/teichoic acid export membrane protein